MSPDPRSRVPALLRILLPACLVVVLMLLATPAQAAKPDQFRLGFADDLFADNLLFSDDAATREQWAARMQEANGSLVRLNTYWRLIATTEPANPTDPADPAYDWTAVDNAVTAADSRGLEPVMTVFNAPDFAEAPGRPGDVRPGTWKPDATKFGQFAEAIATRYSGSYDPDGAGPADALPEVRYWEGWNEPNLHLYINPQRKGKENRSPIIYRKLLNAFYDGIKAASEENTVLTAGTSPFGDPTGDRRIPPIEFWRDVYCLKGRKKIKPSGDCPNASGQAHFDIFAHNSINSPGDGPEVPAQTADNATASDMSKLVKLIRAAEKHETVQPDLKREVWSTELWYESSPPEKKRFALSLDGQADAVANAQYLLWKQGVSAGIFLQIRDSEYKPGGPAVIGLQSGMYFFDEKPKPSLKSAQFPLVADRKSKKKVFLWSRAPLDGTVVLEVKERGEKWQRVGRQRGNLGDVITQTVKQRGKAKFRARAKGLKSRAWPVGA